MEKDGSVPIYLHIQIGSAYILPTGLPVIPSKFSDISLSFQYLLMDPKVVETLSELQIRGGIEDNSKIMFLISQWKQML